MTRGVVVMPRWRAKAARSSSCDSDADWRRRVSEQLGNADRHRGEHHGSASMSANRGSARRHGAIAHSSAMAAAYQRERTDASRKCVKCLRSADGLCDDEDFSTTVTTAGSAINGSEEHDGLVELHEIGGSYPVTLATVPASGWSKSGCGGGPSTPRSEFPRPRHDAI